MQNRCLSKNQNDTNSNKTNNTAKTDITNNNSELQQRWHSDSTASK